MTTDASLSVRLFSKVIRLSRRATIPSRHTLSKQHIIYAADDKVLASVYMPRWLHSLMLRLDKHFEDRLLRSPVITGWVRWQCALRARHVLLHYKITGLPVYFILIQKEYTATEKWVQEWCKSAMDGLLLLPMFPKVESIVKHKGDVIKWRRPVPFTGIKRGDLCEVNGTLIGSFQDEGIRLPSAKDREMFKSMFVEPEFVPYQGDLFK